MAKRRQRRLSFSQLSTWQRCRHQWALRYEEELSSRSERPQLDLGSAVHEGLAAGLTDRNPNDVISAWADEKYKDARLFVDERANLEILIEKAFGLVERTLKFIDHGHKWQTMLLDTVPLVEFEFEAELPVRGWHGFVGYVDWVARDLETGHSWLIDFKVRESFQADDNEETNMQMAIYQHLLKLRGVQAQGSMSFQIKAELPKQPKLNKDLSMSRAACFTDWATYERALIAHNLNPADYEEMKTKLSETEFYRLSRAFRSETEVQNTWDHVVIPGARDIARRSKQIHRSIGFMNCKGCQYKELCFEQLRGGDTDFIISTHFLRKGEKPEIFVPPELVD